MQTFELPNNTKTGYGYTHKVVITAADLTSATNTQTLSLFPVKPGTIIKDAAHKLVTEFVSSDATLVSNAYSLGNTASATSIMSSTEVLGEHASTIAHKASTATAPVAITAAAQSIVAAFTATSDKALNTSTAGEIHLYLNVADTTEI
jgi:hypothetical protein